MIMYISLFELLIYIYAFGICSGLILCAFIIYKHRRKHGVYNRLGSSIFSISIRDFINNVCKRLVKFIYIFPSVLNVGFYN